MTDLVSFLATGPAVLVEVTKTLGSTPREQGACMLVSANGIWGTIGGGQFEFLAIANARDLLRGAGVEVMDIPLGPEIGQCCGGRTELRFRVASPEIIEGLNLRMKGERDEWPDVYLFGAGHVGKSLALALRPLPLKATVVETRREELEGLPEDVETRHSAMPESLIAKLRPGSAIVVLTHDHALDFLIAREALRRDDLAYVGMIGSATKRATFASWLMREGGEKSWLERLVLPIGGTAVPDKRPAVIAAMTTAEILAALTSHQKRSSP
ncbi:xanthine dehydrogenase accessory protein XdhC [Oryzifoliimicrobium ureilyticus]|uniref:xanthine dehydrogenase accessory protein XdhC n=1 Tax=Oryzifoliimicrobium ureilyticus TaxID=3113724 RepID=UPI0030760398